jgi:hypothetical protein
MKNNNVRPTGLKGNDQLNRMRNLMGMAPIHENVKRSVVELIKKGPDGRIYGVVRENHEYYIKIANNKPNLIAEDFNYIGGLKNKKEVVYESYSKAIKQLNLKFISLNEAKGVKDTTDTFRNDKEVINESFESYSEPTKKSQPDTTLGTVGTIGKNDGHDKEIITDAGETGNPDVPTPKVVEEDDDVEGEEITETDEVTEGEEAIDEEVVEEGEEELTEAEKAIDNMITETRSTKTPKAERRLSIEVAIQKIDEGINSQKKK